ncbi:YhgE/Pip domain-containing protein [Paenibacillus sp. J22TS3]|uniref:YhgE/Pip domain-containing protein n=1 Tax=Paenibacillus sp. J22TS3 TaxID=2807192 RepID=UPI001B06B8D2|nr:YhgE/Pip domain-containing protein [Paenibacillus sp. J22TS3]GIP21559.1 phage infection protein [Paenibacillus sp. J22TS3]
MSKIWSIYEQDIRNITTNWAAAVIILGLVLLPSLYAWFNIEASWDPYSSTQGVQIAVTTLDQGAVIQGKHLNLGDEIKKSLQENTNIGWVFVPHDEAQKGLRHGDYYAALEIPADFSTRIASVLTSAPVKAEILYSVNEKINAVAPKITSKGASSVTEEVNRNFVKTANGTIFKIFNEIGVELEKELPLMNKMKGLIFQLVSMFPEINQAADTAVRDLAEGQKIVAQVQQKIPDAVRLAGQGADFASSLIHFLDQTGSALDQAAPQIKNALVQTRDSLGAASRIAADLKGLKPEELSAELPRLEIASQDLAKARDAAGTFLSLIDRLSQLNPGGPLSRVADHMRGISDSVQSLGTKLGQLKQAVQNGSANANDLVNSFIQTSNRISGDLDQLVSSYDSEIVPAISGAVGRAKETAATSRSLLTDAQNSLPKVQKILTDASKGLAVGTRNAELIRGQLPSAEANIKKISERIKAFEKDGRLEDLIRLLQLNYQKESDFFAEPVILTEHKLFPIPNYGSAMSPFFTTLSLWVGGLLLVSMLTVEVHSPSEFQSYQIYLGRFLTFGTLALLQSVFVSTGDLFILGTYAKEKLAFVLFSLLLSLVFMLMIYTLVSVFGNVGKAMAIVLLVLQLAGSGGTFPIQVTPLFFQKIYPFLPFTYGIGLLREAVGGMVPDLVIRDILILLIYAMLALLLGLGLKQQINRLAAPLVSKAKKSGIIH